MARGEKQRQSETMIQAAKSGMEGRQRAHESLIAQEAQGRRDMTQAAVQVGGLAEEGERRQLQKEQGDADRQVRTDIAEDNFKLNERGQRIQAADAGLEGLEPMESERAKRTREEMDRGAAQTGGFEQNPPAAPGGGGGIGAITPEESARLQKQTGRSDLEYTGGGYEAQGPQGIRKSGARLAREEREVRLQEQQIELNAQKLQMNALEHKRALAKPPGEERDRSLKETLGAMTSAIEFTQEEISKVITGETDWNAVADAYATNPQIAQAKESGQLDKARVIEMMRTQLGTQQLTFMATSGEMPPGYDPSNPVIRQFNVRFNEVAAAFRGTKPMDVSQGDAFDQAWGQQEQKSLAGEWVGIRSVEERNNFLRRVTANVMVEADRYRMEQKAQLKASGFQEELAQRDATIAQQSSLIEQLQQQVQILGGQGEGRPQTEMRQGMDEEGNPATPPTKVQKFGPRDEERVRKMQDDNERSARASTQRGFVERGGYQ